MRENHYHWVFEELRNGGKSWSGLADDFRTFIFAQRLMSHPETREGQ